MACGPLVIFGCGGGIVKSVTTGIFDEFTKFFADAAAGLLKAFADQFVSIPGLDFTGSGLGKVYGMSLGIAGIVAALLLLWQVVQAMWTRSGEPLAQAFAGLGKAFIAFALTLSVGATVQDASDQLAAWIVKSSFHDPTNGQSDAQVFAAKMTKALLMSDPTQTLGLGGLLVLLSLICIVVIIILWIEMIMRNAALAVLVATSPISAAGQLSKATSPWWSKTVRATLQLMLLKPTIAMIFAIGFAVGGENSGGITQAITGVCILAIAVIAWPALARFMSWSSSQASSAGGVGALLGFAAGRASTAAGGSPVGSPAGLGAAAGGGGGANGAIAKAAAGAATGGAMTAVTAAASAARAVKSGADAAVGHMDQMAGHAGMGSPTTRIGGGQHYPNYNRGGSGGSGSGGAAAPSGPSDSGSPPAPDTAQPGAAGGYPDDDLAATQEIPFIAPAMTQEPPYPRQAQDHDQDPNAGGTP